MGVIIAIARPINRLFAVTCQAYDSFLMWTTPDEPDIRVEKTACRLAHLAHTPASAAPVCGEQLEGFQYPYPLQHFDFQSQQQSLSMGYMDVKPAQRTNGKTVVLMHGKSFCGATREEPIHALSQQGYHVIAPDQIGFCSSIRPTSYQYTFQQLAENTRQLLTRLGVEKAVIIGHSTGECWQRVMR